MTDHVADHIVLGLDIKAYSQRSLERQKYSQEVLDRCLDLAFAKPDWTGNDPIWIDGGDGGYVLLEGSEQEALRALQRFYEKLAWENRNTSDDKIHVRAALHTDKIIRWDARLGRKYTGNAINNCARLLSGMNRTHDDQVVCSDAFLQKINTLGPDVIVERLQDIGDKHGNKHKVYNIYRMPGFGTTALPSERHPDPLQWENR
jgi:hypothetical protein